VALRPIEIGVWIAMSRRRIIGRIFFDKTTNTQNLDDVEVTNGCSRQDSTTPHTARRTINYSEELFQAD
jgi:hypothetical protein